MKTMFEEKIEEKLKDGFLLEPWENEPEYLHFYNMWMKPPLEILSAHKIEKKSLDMEFILNVFFNEKIILSYYLNNTTTNQVAFMKKVIDIEESNKFIFAFKLFS